MSEVGWLVIGVAMTVAVSAVGWHASRRRRELALTPAHLELAAVDSLTGRQFARLCAALLRVQATGGCGRLAGGAGRWLTSWGRPLTMSSSRSGACGSR